MAITHNNLQSAINTTTLSSYTPPSLTDSCLVVIVTSEDIGNNDPITGITFDSAPMVEGVISHHVKGSSAQDVAIFYLVNPGTSSGDIVVSGSERQAIIAITLDNVDQSSTVDATGTAGFDSGTSLSVSATTLNNDSFAVSGACSARTSNVLTVTTATKIISLFPSSATSAVAVSTQATAGLFTHDWVGDVELTRAASAVIAFNLAAGGISITETLKNINYNSLDPTIALTGMLAITENLVNTNYETLNPNITFTGAISITEQLNNTNYTSLDPIIDLTGLVDVTESTVNTNYTALNVTVTLTAGVIEITEQLANTNYNTFNPSILLTPEPVGIVSTVCFDGQIDRLAFDGAINQIAFNGKIINQDFDGFLKRLEFNGNLKEREFNGDSKQLVFNGTIATTC